MTASHQRDQPEQPAASPKSAASGPSAASAESAPIACNLGAFAPEQRARHAALVRELMVDLPTATGEIAHGYEFHYRRDDATLAKLVEWIGYESQCCGFFTFDLQVAPRNGPIRLRWHGDEPAARDIIKAAVGYTSPPTAAEC